MFPSLAPSRDGIKASGIGPRLRTREGKAILVIIPALAMTSESGVRPSSSRGSPSSRWCGSQDVDGLIKSGHDGGDTHSEAGRHLFQVRADTGFRPVRPV